MAKGGDAAQEQQKPQTGLLGGKGRHEKMVLKVSETDLHGGPSSTFKFLSKMKPGQPHNAQRQRGVQI